MITVKEMDTGEFSHLGICVSDLEQSLKFYCDGLGFAVAEGYDLTDELMPGLANALEVSSPVELRSQMIVRGDLKVELLAYSEPAVTGSPSGSRGQLGYTHLNFIVDDVDAVAKHLAKFGGTILEHTDTSAGVQILFITDPDGTRIELMST